MPFIPQLCSHFQQVVKDTLYFLKIEKAQFLAMEEGGIQIGDRVKLVLDKEISRDNRWHGKIGEVIDISFDDAASVTGNPKDNFLYKVELEGGTIPEVHFRRADIMLLE